MELFLVSWTGNFIAEKIKLPGVNAELERLKSNDKFVPTDPKNLGGFDADEMSKRIQLYVSKILDGERVQFQ